MLKQIDFIEQLIAAEKLRGEDTAKEEKDLAALKLKLSEQVAKKQMEDAKKVTEVEKEAAQLRKELANEVFNFAETVITGSLERRKNKIGEEIEAIGTRTEAEKKAVEESVLSENDKNTPWHLPGGVFIWIISLHEILLFFIGIIIYKYQYYQNSVFFNSQKLYLSFPLGMTYTILLLTSGWCIAESLKLYRSNQVNKGKIYHGIS